MHHDIKLLDEAGRLAALARSGQMHSAPDTESDALTNLMGSVFAAPVVQIAFLDDKHRWVKSSCGVPFPQIPREQSFCDYTIARQTVLAVPDTRADERFRNHKLANGPQSIRAYLGAPLTTPDGYNIGTLCIADYKPRDFTPRDLDMMRNFSRLAMSTFELRQIAARDQLTDTWSRRAFLELLQQAVARWQRNGQPVSLVLFDIDHFKSVNDRFGHATGDAVLKAAAGTVLAAMRKEEAIGRLGGEEFSIVMPGTTAAGACLGAERIRHAMEMARMESLPGFSFTASFGVAELTGDETVERWIERADQAMYRAKAEGRNRVATA